MVIGGRVANPALFLASLMHRFGWRAPDRPQLGQGVLVSHLLDCAAQVSGGYIADPGAVARGRLALQLLDQCLQRLGLGGREHRAKLVGVDAMHGKGWGMDRECYEVRVRLAVRCTMQGEAERVGRELEAMYLNGPAAGGGVTQSVREVIAAASCLVPRDAAGHAVTLLAP